MNKKRKVLITVTYNEMGIIIDTKAEEVAQPDLQPTCNKLATDTISRQAAIDAICEHGTDLERRGITVLSVANHKQVTVDLLEALPSVQPEPSSVRESDADHIWYKGKQFISLTGINKMMMGHPKCTDTISRQAAIDKAKELFDMGDCYCDKYSIVGMINSLPSAQPDIIYCKDCRKHNANAGYKEDCCPLYEWRGLSYGHEHDYQYCCHAERRTDGVDS